MTPQELAANTVVGNERQGSRGSLESIPESRSVAMHAEMHLSSELQESSTKTLSRLFSSTSNTSSKIGDAKLATSKSMTKLLRSSTALVSRLPSAKLPSARPKDLTHIRAPRKSLR